MPAAASRYRAGLYANTEQGVRWNADSESVIGDASLAFDVGQTGELVLQFTDITQNLGGNRPGRPSERCRHLPDRPAMEPQRGQ